MAPDKLITSDLLHNENCFNYLRNLSLAPIVLDKLPRAQAVALRHIQNQGVYNPQIAYGDLYANFFDYVEEHIVSIYDQPRDALLKQQYRAPVAARKELQAVIDALDDFVTSLYHNDNNILEDTFNKIKGIVLQINPSASNIEHDITQFIQDTWVQINQNSASPIQAGSAYGRFHALMSPNFKPQHSTSLASIRHYQANRNGPIEYRIGTQGQRHHGEVRVSPLFERFLKIRREATADKVISHVYFNNLGRDHEDFEGLKEQALTFVLEDLERRHPNVAVITLPADKGLMDRHSHKNTNEIYDVQKIKDQFLAIALEVPNTTPKVKDFHISANVRAQLFCDQDGRYSPALEKAELQGLIDKSFNVLGFAAKEKLSPAQKQAVWFHFVKFALTNRIIETLNPHSINFSCKDAIDRGAASSAYYNLIKSFATENNPEQIPLTREEFATGLHAAATMVKGRGMNHHLNLVWNAVDSYVRANYEQLNLDPQKAWLIEWRDFNCPHYRVAGLLTERVDQFIQELQQAVANVPNANKNQFMRDGLVVLQEIKQQNDMRVSGKRLLLESASRTRAMTLNPETQTPYQIKRYYDLSDQLDVKYPKLIILAGMLKQVVAHLVAVFSEEQKEKLMRSGNETIQAGRAAQSRHDLQQHMKVQLQTLKANAFSEEIKREQNPSVGVN